MDELHNFKCQVLQYNSLKDAIPKDWQEKLRTMNVPKDTIHANEDLHINIERHDIPKNANNKQVYWKII